MSLPARTERQFRSIVVPEAMQPSRIWPGTAPFTEIAARLDLYRVEFKKNGPRTFVVKRYAEDDAEFWSRHGKQHPFRIIPPQIKDWAFELPPGTVLDAELLTARRAGADPEEVDRLYVFDVVRLRGADACHVTLERRKELLGTVAASGDSDGAILVATDLREYNPGATLSMHYERALLEGDEGVVLKLKSSLYRGGESPCWLKIRKEGA